MIIRQANTADIPYLEDLQDSIMDSEAPLSSEDWEDVIANECVYCALSADNEIVGALVAVDDPSGDLKIDRLFVDASHRRNGIGESLILQFIELQNNSVKTAFLRVGKDNAPAINLYRKMGFEDTEDVIPKYLTPSARALYESHGIAQNFVGIMVREPDELAL